MSNSASSQSRNLAGKIALVTGGSKGFGRGIVEALAGAGATVWALARTRTQLEALQQAVPGVQIIAADMNESGLAERLLGELRPDLLVLNAGSTPVMQPIQTQNWEDFSQVWNTDVKSTLAFGSAALLTPLAPGSQVLVVSSGAAVAGSLLSGGYAGAKRMQWLMTGYLQQEAANLKLDIRFRVLVPRQISPLTELGQAAVSAYSERQGISHERFLERFGATLTPARVGEAALSLFAETGDGLAWGLTSTELAVMA